MDREAEIAALKAEVKEANQILAAAQYQALQIAGERDSLKAENKRLKVRKWQLMGALGYPCPGEIAEDPKIKNGLAEAAYQGIDRLQGENERLKKSLDDATNNVWSEWELERGKVKGENLSQAFTIDELKTDLASARERIEKIREWRLLVWDYNSKEKDACIEVDYEDWVELKRILSGAKEGKG